MITKATLALIGTVSLGVCSVAAQDDVTRALNNGIGLVAYCADNNFLDSQAAQSATDRMKATLEFMGGAKVLDPEAEAAGRAGLWGTSAMPVADRAALFDQSIEAFCAELVADL